MYVLLDRHERGFLIKGNRDGSPINHYEMPMNHLQAVSVKLYISF